ncbi:MAG TPA: ketose-bisphosphate aldolase [Candidatus Hydrogenedentes bacterium]|nr:ketose-bisphosphate aldolase [Candidatus Hydrogenedentota bacterium]HOT50263.1 ketose-bisphosphate aldolase [Candidatus Hydrogenedentota bacterium]HOV74399.1 ketose-bisphosphate aldolase [Candidatus Hydrogenedentota bacterium]HPC16657.1 ketose-bisphosphate aldolase [Candidatus Hydrogenedentota bacterium]HRT21207.1 ketose-bisphosphate aldolase [Candidatus Hydrogenedentota bacterium]
MPLVPMRQILDEAAKGGYGVGAFNVNNMEQIQAIMQAAHDTKSPVIIQASRGALKYSKMIYLRNLIKAAEEEFPEIPLAMHLDHGNSVETCEKAIELGFTSVMIDGSLAEDGKTPNTYEANVAITKKVVEMAHPLGVTVEGELGCLGGIEDGHGAGLSVDEVNAHLTDPAQAEEFVAATGVDALAVAIGTSHGAYKSGRKDPVTGKMLPPMLAMERIHQIHARMPNCHMVMHGSSSVPQELVDIINQYGGKMPGTFGIPIEQIQDGIKHGVRKINVDTDSRLAMTGAVRKLLAEKPEKFDPRDWLGPAREAAYQVYVARMKAFGQAGHAGDYVPMTLDDMKKVYAAAK